MMKSSRSRSPQPPPAYSFDISSSAGEHSLELEHEDDDNDRHSHNHTNNNNDSGEEENDNGDDDEDDDDDDDEDENQDLRRHRHTHRHSHGGIPPPPPQSVLDADDEDSGSRLNPHHRSSGSSSKQQQQQQQQQQARNNSHTHHRQSNHYNRDILVEEDFSPNLSSFHGSGNSKYFQQALPNYSSQQRQLYRNHSGGSDKTGGSNHLRHFHGGGSPYPPSVISELTMGTADERGGGVASSMGSAVHHSQGIVFEYDGEEEQDHNHHHDEEDDDDEDKNQSNPRQRQYPGPLNRYHNYRMDSNSTMDTTEDFYQHPHYSYYHQQQQQQHHHTQQLPPHRSSRSQRKTSSASVLEYSDSEDCGGSSFGASQQHHHRHPQQQQLTGDERGSTMAFQRSSQSSFRNTNLTGSTRVVKFTASTGSLQVWDDEEDADDNNNNDNNNNAGDDDFLTSPEETQQKSDRQHAYRNTRAQRSKSGSNSNSNSSNEGKDEGKKRSGNRQSSSSGGKNHKFTRRLREKTENWMTQLMYTFRSPVPTHHARKQFHPQHHPNHRHPDETYDQMESKSTLQYPHHISAPRHDAALQNKPFLHRSLDDVLSYNSKPLSTVVGTNEGGGKLPLHNTNYFTREKNVRTGGIIFPPPSIRSDSPMSQDSPEEQIPLLAGRAALPAARGRNLSVPVLSTTLQDSVLEHSSQPAAFQSNNFVAMAATFLQDYEHNRPPTFVDLLQISDYQLWLYRFKFSVPFSLLLTAATFALFGSCCFEGILVSHSAAADATENAIIVNMTEAELEHQDQLSKQEQFNNRFNVIILTALNLFSLTIFTMDVWIRWQLRPPISQNKKNQQRSYQSKSGMAAPSPPSSPPMSAQFHLTHSTRSSRSERLEKPLILFGIILGLENLARFFVVTDDDRMLLFSSVFKPLVFFYVSSQARDAMEALRRIIRIVVRVLIVELLLILMFAAVACRLFSNYDRFASLSTAWLSLFELATTVVNPGIWLPMYQANKMSALFFIFFVVTAVFYLHSLVLSVVFQTYIKAVSDIHERSSADREDAIHLAYLALQHGQKRKDAVDIQLVRETLKLVRPHYNGMKINALIEIVDPSNQRVVDYPTFRTKMRQALNASIRTARSASPLAVSIELIAVAVAVVNFVYVILVSSAFDYEWFNSVQILVGAIITLVAGFELLIRFNPLRIPDFTPLTRLNTTFDGLALAGALISSVGILLFIFGRPGALEYILMGRAIDMIRIMRFFQIFRDVVRRSADVIPALEGPVILVITTLHIFVYLGMALWGGAVDVGAHFGKITYLYDLNNFNSYQEGLVTMFQVLVVNDWHAIAEVFLYAERCATPYIVYPFFVAGNLLGVSIMLNVVTAFFVESFVTKLAGGTDGPAETTTMVHKDKDFTIVTSGNSNSVRRVVSTTSAMSQTNDDGAGTGSDQGADADSENSLESELYEFDVYEREGFDKIMQTVAGGVQQQDYVQTVCNYLEIFESLTPGRETVGYLACDQQTLERFGNRRFQNMAVGFLEENELHAVVSDMHSELLALSARASFRNDRALIRTFRHKHDPGLIHEISASLLRRHPAVSLFVSRRIRASGNPSPSIPE